jgi:hypothetical protein
MRLGNIETALPLAEVCDGGGQTNAVTRDGLSGLARLDWIA